jgi:hypothetical protein
LHATKYSASGTERRNKSLFGSFSSEKEQESSFSKEKEAKRLLFLAASLEVAIIARSAAPC